MEERNFFVTGVNTDVSKWIEQKNGLDYLEWSAAMTLVKTLYPKTYYVVHKDEKQKPWFTDEVSNSGWVEVTVVIPELELSQTAPYAIMDFKNKAATIDKITSVEANKSIRRCIVKIISELTGIGLGLYRKSDDSADDKAVALAKEKLNEIYAKRAKLSDEAKEKANAIANDTAEKIKLAVTEEEKLGIYDEAKKLMLAIRK